MSSPVAVAVAVVWSALPCARRLSSCWFPPATVIVESPITAFALVGLFPTECALPQCKNRCSALSRRNNADNVEPTSRRPSARQTPHVAPRYRDDVFLFFPGHGGRRWCKAGVGAGLHLDEAKYVVVPPYQVDLTAVLEHPKIASHHAIPQLLQIQVSLGLPQPAQPEMILLIGLEAPADQLQCTD